jgi:excisionase family DNA binding protein
MKDQNIRQAPERPLGYSIDKAVAASGLSRATIYRLIGEGQLKATKIGSRTVIPASSLLALIEGN